MKNTKNLKKKILVILALVLAAVTLASCSVSVKSTSTTTETRTDANGNTITTTTTTENDNGKVTTTTTTEEKTAEEKAAEEAADGAQTVKYPTTVSFENETGYDIIRLNIAQHSADNWGPNLLADGERLENAKGLRFPNLLPDTKEYPVWDVRADYAHGDQATILTFENLDLSKVADPENIVIIFKDNGEGGFKVNFK